MCNPRRVVVTATRELAEAWQREVSRTAECRQRVRGDARVRQSLRASLGDPVLRALDVRLGQGVDGWQAVPEGYRFAVDGGYALYLTESQELEIVAFQEEEVEVSHTARQLTRGEVHGHFQAEVEERYYDDGWGGHSLESAQQTGQQKADAEIARQARARVEEAQQAEEARIAEDLQAQAQTLAQQRTESLATSRKQELARQSASRLDSVGIVCRQAFHRLLGDVYQDAIISYARLHQAEGLVCRDKGGVIDIEFQITR